MFETLSNCWVLQVIVFERGDLVFVFNFHPDNTYDGYVCSSFAEVSACLFASAQITLFI